MLRYCTNCKKEFEFSTMQMAKEAELICPECHQVIDKNSRHPVDYETMNQVEEDIGRAFSTFYRLAYVFYCVTALFGIAGFCLKINWLLYAATAVALLAFTYQLVTGRLFFRKGVFFLPLGAAAGFYLFRSLEGAFLGIHVVFLIRHLIRDLLFTLIGRFIGWSRRQ